MSKRDENYVRGVARRYCRVIIKTGSQTGIVSWWRPKGLHVSKQSYVVALSIVGAAWRHGRR